MRKFALLGITLMLTALTYAQGYKIGDVATDFNLKNIDGKMVKMADDKAAKGFVVIFTCNHCPYAVAYEDRIVALDKKYRSMGYPVIAINPNDPAAYPADSFEAMQKRAKEKGFTFPYLVDETQQVAKTYGATKTPHVYLLQKNNNKLVVKYIGTIDDNYQDADEVKEPYLANAIESLLAGETIPTVETKAVGCSIKWKK
ncbi:MAG: thioredoxin family protein [Breznakibacter sp.]